MLVGCYRFVRLLRLGCRHAGLDVKINYIT
jgi:hypothetical protein